MAQNTGDGLPILIVGGGIGGLAAAHALALKGFPVRVIEQAPEFREIGAGIQLGPNIFRALDKLGLKDAVLADAHVPTAMEMRCGLSGERVTCIPLADPRFLGEFKYPYAVTHRHDIHAVFLKACQSNNLVTLETERTVEDFEQDNSGVTAILTDGQRVRGRALIGCDGMWSKVREKVVGDGKPRVSGHIAYRAVLRRDEVPEDLGAPTSSCGPGRALTSCIIRSAVASSTTLSPYSIPTIMWKGGTRKQTRMSCGRTSGASGRKWSACWSASRPGGCGCYAIANR